MSSNFFVLLYNFSSHFIFCQFYAVTYAKVYIFDYFTHNPYFNCVRVKETWRILVRYKFRKGQRACSRSTYCVSHFSKQRVHPGYSVDCTNHIRHEKWSTKVNPILIPSVGLVTDSSGPCSSHIIHRAMKAYPRHNRKTRWQVMQWSC